MSRGIGDQKLLQKRIPRSARYDNVRAKTDTGASMSKHLARLNEIQNNYRIQKGELFKRIRISTFSQLVLQVDQVNKMSLSAEAAAQENHENHENEEKSIIGGGGGAEHPTFLDVINGTGELSVKDQNIQAALPPKPEPDLLLQPYPQMPYLLVDVRDIEEYNECHIISALSYPAQNFTRTMNPFSPEMYNFKNVDGKIIILYDVDEFLATHCAHQMVQRGFENIFVLSGGLRLIAQKISSGLTTGSFPPECFLSLDKKTQIRKFDPKNQYPADKRQRFSNEDLSNLSDQLDSILSAPSDISSRYTSNRTPRGVNSSRSMSTRSGATNGGSKPWK
jgi:centrosomal protein CEP41